VGNIANISPKKPQKFYVYLSKSLFLIKSVLVVDQTSQILQQLVQRTRDSTRLKVNFEVKKMVNERFEMILYIDLL
jgi:hypothetical protein